MKTRSRNDTELMEEPRSSSPIHEYIPIPTQVTSPDAVMDSADVTPECLCFPDQSSVQSNQSTHMSADESGHSPVQFHQNTQMPGCEEETYKSDSQSDSASVVSDNSQLETSSDHSEESEISETNNIDIADIKPETHVQYSMAQMTAFLLTDRGKQCITSAVADGFRDAFNPVDDT